MCFSFPQKPSTGNSGYDRASLLSNAEANQRLSSEYKISTHNAVNRKKKKEQRKATLRCLFMPSANCIWFSLRSLSVSMFERLDSAQPWAKGEATNNGSSISLFFLIYIHIGCHSSLETKSFNLTPVADNRSSSTAACTREIGR